MLESLSFEEAVGLFKMLGFVVEPGPRSTEVSLILKGHDHCTYVVWDAVLLPAIAGVALRGYRQAGLGPAS